jgi:hypothetical protein
VELLARENNALAINRAVAKLKSHLKTVPYASVWCDVLSRCKEEVHLDLMQWIEAHMPQQADRRMPKNCSPKHNVSIWILYHAADLTCSDTPPRRSLAA